MQSWPLVLLIAGGVAVAIQLQTTTKARERDLFDIISRRDDELARREEHTNRVMGQISAQYVNRVLIDMGLQRHSLQTTGRRSCRVFRDRLNEFVSMTIVPEGGATAGQPVRPEFQKEYDRLKEILQFSPEGVLRQLRDVGFLANELNAPHHELMPPQGPPGFYVGGRQFSNDLIAVIALVCAAMERDEGGCFPPVRVLTRDDVIAFLLHDGLVQTTPM